MISATAEPWPWLLFAGLGFFHGINPAMGWLFAVALGLHQRSRRTLILAWIPIALGHAASVGVVLIGVLALGLVADRSSLSRAAAATLIGWAAWHAVRGHRGRLRIGMQAGLFGLALWSFLMATAHGAGLMLIPVALPLCLGGSPGGQLPLGGGMAALAGFGVHTTAMLATIAAVSVIVYEWAGLGFLRAGWINLDLIWIVALGTCGVALMLG